MVDAVEPHPPPNRLSIAHLLLWTFGSAIVLALQRAAQGTHTEDTPYEALRPVYHVCMSLTGGAQLGSIILLGWQRWHGVQRFPVDPGHWLLLVRGVIVCVHSLGLLAVMALSRVLENQPANSYLPVLPFLALQVLVAITAVAGYGLAWRYTTDAGQPWRIAFGLIVAQYLLAAIFGLLSLWESQLYIATTALNGLSFIGISGVLILATCCDPLRAQRDFLHWTGVVASLFGGLVATAWPLVIVYVR